jgi:hypothetical protein
LDKNPEKVIGVRRIEDIEGEVTSLVAELSEKKEKAENAANNSVTEIHNSFEDAKEKTEERIGELNTKRLDLERQIKSKLVLASAPLKSSVHIFRHNLVLIKSEYEKSLIIPIVAFFLVVFVYDPISAYISPSFPWVNYAEFGIPLIKMTLFLLSFLLTWNSYQKIKNSFYVDSNQLEKNIDIIERSDISTEAINISKQKFKDVEPIVKDAKGVFEAFIINLGKSTPVLRQTFDQMTLLAKYSRLIEGIQRALVFYNLLIDGKFYTSLEKNPHLKYR